jgi:hypothetical protein
MWRSGDLVITSAVIADFTARLAPHHHITTSPDHQLP